MKWSYLIWSIVILVALTILSQYISKDSAEPPGLWGFFIFGWLGSIVGALIILILRAFRWATRHSFLYIFLGISCIYLGFAGLWIWLDVWKKNQLFVALYTSTLILGIIMLLDAFRVLPSTKKGLSRP